MNWDVKFQEWLARLCVVNTKLEEFPKPSGFSGTKYYLEPELKRIMLRTFPRSFQIQISRSRKTLDEYSLESLQEYLKACLKEGEKSTHERAKLKHSQNKNRKDKVPFNDKSYTNRDSKRRRSEGGETSKRTRKKKFFRNCKDSGKPRKLFKSHNTIDYNFKKNEPKSSQKLYNLLKNTEKRLGKLEKFNRDDSDSDSDAS